MRQNAHRHKYPLTVSLWSAGIPSVFVLIGLSLLPRWAKTVFSVLSSLVRNGVPGQEDLGLLWAPWLFVLVGGIGLSQYTEVIITEKGMRVRVFLFFWALILWQDVLGITMTPLMLGASDPSTIRLVQVRQLTFFHRILGICYFTGVHPVLFINRHMEDYEELVRVIEEHVEQNQVLAEGAESD